MTAIERKLFECSAAVLFCLYAETAILMYFFSIVIKKMHNKAYQYLDLEPPNNQKKKIIAFCIDSRQFFFLTKHLLQISYSCFMLYHGKTGDDAL